MSRSALTATYLLALVMVGWDEIKRQHRVPRPERFIYVTVVWGVLGVVAELGAEDLAALFGAGLFLTLVYQLLQGKDMVEQHAAETNPVRHATEIGG